MDKIALVFVALLATACEGGGFLGGSSLGCTYDYSIYRISPYGSSFDQYQDECIEVDSQEECDLFTEDDNSCYGSSCTEWSYTNVRLVSGGCPGGDESYGYEYY